LEPQQCVLFIVALHISLPKNVRKQVCLHVKGPIFLSHGKKKFGFSQQIFIEVPLINVAEIRPVAGTLIYVTGGTRRNEGNRNFSRLRLKTTASIPPPPPPMVRIYPVE